jgi:hypothetical protein
MKESYTAAMKKSSAGMHPQKVAPSSFSVGDEAPEPSAQVPPRHRWFGPPPRSNG